MRKGKSNNGRSSIFSSEKEMRKSLSMARARRSVSTKGGRPTTQAMDEASLQNHIEKEKLRNVLRDHASKQLRKYGTDKSQNFYKWIKDHTNDKIEINEKVFYV